MLETMFASFNEQGIEVALPDIPEQPAGFAAKVPHGAEAKGASYETVEKPLAAAHFTLTATGYDCGDSHSTGFSCEVQNWRVVVEDVEAPVVDPDGATIAVAVVRPAPEERSSRRDPLTRLSSRSTPTQRG